MNRLLTKLKLATFAGLLLSALTMSAHGLKFQGMECPIEERGSCKIFDRHSPVFRDSMSISFDYLALPKSAFGYVFRLAKTLAPDHTCNLSIDRRMGKVVVKLNDEGFRSLITAELDSEELPYHKWTHINVSMDPASDSVYLKVGGRSFAGSFSFQRTNFRPSLVFGISEHVVELPSFCIRDILITDGSKSFFFPLDDMDGTRIYDSKGVCRGHTVNTTWLADEAHQWKQIADIECTKPSGAFYDYDNHELTLYSQEDLISLNISTERMTSRPYANVCPMNILSGTSYVHDGKLYAYELHDWVHGKGTASACLDLSTLRWKALGEERFDGPMHHHAAFMDKYTGEYTMYGGYGNMFFNDVFYAFDGKGHWHLSDISKDDDPQLTPRFFVSSGLDESGRYAYLFGGLGNESGEEVVGRRNFYELHRVDLEKRKCEYLWTADWKDDRCVPARGLVVDGNWIYVLCYPEYKTQSTMYLYRFDIRDGSFSKLDSGIPVVSDKVWSSSTMYLDRELGSFVVVSLDVERNLIPRVSVHTLVYPPVMEMKRPWLRDNALIVIIVGNILLLALVCAIVAVVVRRRNSEKRMESDEYILSKSDPNKRIYTYAPAPNSILLFGEFTVIDRRGNDISDAFSPQLRNLLLLLFKYSDSGLSSSRMSSILWPDKDMVKARNSRGVAINSIRNLLSSLRGISLEHVDGIYRLVPDAEFHCDLLEVKSLLADSKSEEALRILSRGKFLRDVQDPVFDSFKADVESIVVTFLENELKIKHSERKHRAVIEISEMLFACDPLNEKALKDCVSSLLSLGRREDALVRYSSFSASWNKLEGEPYPVKFNFL